MNKKNYLRTTKNLYYIDEKPQLRVYYSYTTPVALMIDGHLKVSQNQWSITTGRHLTWIDGGNKKARLSPKEFDLLLKEHKPEDSNFLKSVSSVSAIFGLMCQNDIKTKNKYQKKFFDKVEGLDFPNDWETLTEEEKARRLEGATKIGLEQ